MSPPAERSKPQPRCPRCKSKRLQRRLDGGVACDRCGQRVAPDGRLIPSADRRGTTAEKEPQMHLL